NSHYALARYHIYNGSSQKARLLLKKLELNPKNRIEKENQKYFYLYSSILDSIDGKYLSAYSNFRNYNNQNVFNTIQKNQNAFNELEAKYQTAEKEKQILVEQQRATTNRNWLIAAILALVLGAGFATLLHKNTTKKRLLAEKDALLKQERVNNLLKQQELMSIDAMIAGQEKERQRVANELHDDLGSLMATIKLHFDKANENQNKTALKQAQKLLEEAYQKVRGMAHRRNSGVMGDQGLVPAIQKMAGVISGTNALQVHVEAFGMGERLENSLELNLFRMVQELVANVVKHAQATQVSIQLTQHDDLLNIIVEDDGKGFNRAQLNPTKRGMGLTNIEKRVEHLEGSFTIDSVLGKGTSILIDIPV
ncbi:MAG: sensor histidine kinase, partial [Croceitalea sp.]|nr:sensor histidine kinase [Croceitalea sp.]